MSHDIEIVEGRACIAYTGEMPWHKLGKDGRWTDPRKMMVDAGADWRVELRNAFTEFKVGDKIKRIPTGQRALIRIAEPLKVLTTTGKNWHPIQNEEAFDFFHDYVKKGSLVMNTAGVLRGGHMVWALAKAANGFSLFKGRDEIESYVLFYNSHQYGKSSGVMSTNIRVVCNNTFAAALDNKTENEFHARISHRRPFKPEEVRRQLDQVARMVAEYKQIAELLSTKQMTDAAFKEFVGEVFQSKSEDEGKQSRLAKIAKAVLETQPGAELGAGSWWAGWNAITFTTDHLMGQQYKEESDDVAMRDRRLTQTWFGSTQRRKVWALQRAAELARKSRAA